MHETLNLPWWMIIMLTTMSIRTLMVFPLTVHQQQVAARLQNLNKELGELAPELNKEVNIAKRLYNWDALMARKVFKNNMRSQYNKLVIRDNCHPFKLVLLAMFQIPIWICFSMALRNLTLMVPPCSHDLFYNAGLICTQLQTEGVLWFTNLTVPDQIILPALLAFVNLSLIEIHALNQLTKGSLLQKVMTNCMRGVTVFVAIAAALNPTCVSFYWLCSSTIGVGQTIFLMQPRVRRIFRIPKTAIESSTPIKDMIRNVKKRIGN